MSSDPLTALLDVIAILDDLELRYTIGGSIASSVFGERRASADADLTVDIPQAQLGSLVARLEDGYHVSEDAARCAVRRHSSFNVIHLDSMYKVDLFVAGPSHMDREELRRRVSIALTTTGEPPRSSPPPRTSFFASSTGNARAAKPPTASGAVFSASSKSRLVPSTWATSRATPTTPGCATSSTEPCSRPRRTTHSALSTTDRRL